MESGDRPVTSPCSFEEFRLYYDSTEKVTDRRLDANRWNYSISVAVLLAIAGVYSWGASHRTYFLLAGIAILVLSGLAAMFCLFWLRQVEDWKALNRAKFEVLNEMARQLDFTSGDTPSAAKSFRPFEREWDSLQRSRTVRPVRIKLGQIEALNASGAELFMPRALMSLFGLLFVAIVITVLVSWRGIPHNVAPPPPTPTTHNTSTVHP